MRFPLRFLFVVTTWVALAAFAGTISGRLLGLVLAVSFAAAATLALRDKRLAAIIIAGLAGVIGMVAGELLFAYVIPWPVWAADDTRVAVQQYMLNRWAAFCARWVVSGSIVGIVVAAAVILGCMWYFRRRLG